MGHLVVELILAVILAVFGLISTILISAAGKVVADDFKDLAPPTHSVAYRQSDR